MKCVTCGTDTHVGNPALTACMKCCGELERLRRDLARYRRAVDAFCEAECTLPMARWIHAPHYVKALFALRTKPPPPRKA